MDFVGLRSFLECDHFLGKHCFCFIDVLTCRRAVPRDGPCSDQNFVLFAELLAWSVLFSAENLLRLLLSYELEK